MDTVGLWVATALIAWAGSLVFAAFGLFMGYLLPSENVMQIIGPGLAILAFAGGLFVPLEDGSTLQKIAQFTPMYGISVAGPRAADRRRLPVELGAQRRRLAGDLRRRRDLAVPQGHRAGLTAPAPGVFS